MAGYYHICPSISLSGLSGHAGILWGQKSDDFGYFCSAFYLNSSDQVELSGNSSTIYSTSADNLFTIQSPSGVAVIIKADDCISDPSRPEMTLFGDLSVTGCIYGLGGTYVTGGTFNNSTDCITLTRNDNCTVDINITGYNYNSLINKPNHDDLTGFVANEHIDHTNVSFNGIRGIEGGGDISSSRTFCLSGQALCLHDATFSNSSLLAKNSNGTFTSVATGSVANGSNNIPTSNEVFSFVASTSALGNVNIDHSAVCINTTNGIQGGGDITSSRTLGLSGNALCIHCLSLDNSSLIAKDSGGTWVSLASTAFVDSTGDTITGDLSIQGNLTVQGTTVTLNTEVCTTSAMEITNQGTGPALVVNQCGSQPIVNFIDYDGVCDNSVFYIEDGGNVGLGITNPDERLSVVGNISASGIICALNGCSTEWNEAYNNYICAINVTGGTTKTITLTQNDGGTLSANFTDNNNIYTCWSLSASDTSGTYDVCSGCTVSFCGGNGIDICRSDNVVSVINTITNNSQLSNGCNYIKLTSLSVGAEGTPSGNGSLSYSDTTGVFTYTPPLISNETIAISAGTDLSTGGSFTLNQSSGSTVTINHSNITRTDDTSTASPAHEGTFTVIDSVSSNATGHITGVNTKTITLPAASTPNNATITLSAGDGLTAGGDFTTNQSSNETITFNVGVGTGLEVGPSQIFISEACANEWSTNNYLSAASFNTGNGELTLGRHNLSNITVDLDGRYCTSDNDTTYSLLVQDLTSSNTTAKITLSSSGTDSDITIVGSTNITVEKTNDSTLTITGPDLSGYQSSLTFGIADTNAVCIDDADAANNDYAKFTANGLEGSSYAEVRSDLGLGTIYNCAATDFDKYTAWRLYTDTTDRGNITSGEQVRFCGGTDLSLGYAATNNVITFNHDAVASTSSHSGCSVGYGGSFTVVCALSATSQGHTCCIGTMTITLPDSDENDTTYDISASSTTGGANLNLNAGGSGSGTDSVKLASGTGITVSFTDASTITINHPTQTAITCNCSNGIVLQDITVNTLGHVTAVGTYDLDNRYYTETESDNKYLLNTTDTLTGNLTVTGNVSAAGLWDNGNNVWHAGNDGSGSGLDADTVDGAHANNFSLAAMSTFRNSICSCDSRAVNYDPEDRDRGLYADFKTNTTDGLSDGGTYHGVLTFRPYGSTTDMSGGYPSQLGFTGNNNLWIRQGTGCTTWGSWYKFWHTGNDGSGSGLDADLLDGQHGSYYLNYNNLSNKPTIPTVYDSTITITAGTDLATGGSFTLNQNGACSITINHDVIGRTNTTSSASPAHSGTFTVVDSITTSSTGHITGVNTKTVTLPADNNTVYTHPTQTAITCNCSNGVVLQDITVNTLGHVTAVGTCNLDDRYYTESEVDTCLSTCLDNYLLNTTDTLSGTLTVTCNVGIGTTSPTKKLDVNGDVKITGDTLNAGFIQAYGSNFSVGANNYGVFLGTYSGGTGISPGEIILSTQGKTGWNVGDGLGRIRFFLGDSSGVGVRDVAKIEAVNEVGDGATTTTSSGALTFYTSPYNSQVSERVRIDSDGNVGIGTTDPSYKLDVSGDIQLAANYSLIAANNRIWHRSSGSTSGAGTANGFTVTLNNVHGTTLNTAWQYRVQLVTMGTSTDTGASYIVNYNDAAGAWEVRYISLKGDTSNHPLLSVNTTTLVAYTNHSGNYYINVNVESIYCYEPDSTFHTFGADYHWQRGNSTLYYTDGNVGIGTTSPLSRLHTYVGTTGARNSPIDVLTLETEHTADTEFNGFGQGIVFRGSTYNNNTQRTIGRILHQINDDSINTTRGTSLSFQTLDNATATSPTTKLHINYDGNVGIGTTDPGSKLHIDSKSGIGTIDNAYSLAIRGDGIDGIQILSDSAYSGRIVFGDQDSNTSGQIRYDHSTDAFRFFTNGTEKVSILSGGNVGIGTTNPSAKLTTLGITGTTIIQALGTDSNGFADVEIKSTGTTGASRLFFSDTAAQSGFIKYNHSDNSMQFGTSASVRMHIDTSGNVGIGTTDPNAKLDVISSNNVNILKLDVGSYATYKFTANSTSKYTTLFNMDNTGLDIGHDSTIRSLNLRTGNTDRLTILGNGNVGIGITNPSQKLHVNGTICSTCNIYGVCLYDNGNRVCTAAYPTVPTNYITNDADDTMNGTLTVTGNVSAAQLYDNGNRVCTAAYPTYSTATSTVLGLVKIGYTENGKNYPVELSSGQMFVNVPWTDNDTCYSAGNGISLTGTTFSVAAGTGLTQTTTGLSLSAACQTAIANGATAYGWGDHSTFGYCTTDTNNYVDGISFCTSDGVLKLTRNGVLSDLTVDLDGRYCTTDNNTTYSAGNGISLTGTTFSVAAGIGLTQTTTGLSLSTACQTAIANGATAFSWGDHSTVGYSTTTVNNSTITFNYGACIEGYVNPDSFDLNQSSGESFCFKHSTGGAGAGSYSAGCGCAVTGITLDAYGHVNGITISCSTSDYRAKTCIQSYDIGYDAVKTVEAYKYVLIDDEEQTLQAGMMAHELQEAGVFHGTYGIKDEMNEDGTPKYQFVDYSQLVPTLWSALNKAINKIEDLENRLATLELQCNI